MEISSSPRQLSIPEFYNNKSILITGGTGFLGKLITEKLLRSCPGIDNIYLLCRSKKGKNINERLEEITSSPAFDLLREQNPQALNKIILIEGDVAMLELGISKDDQEVLKDKVSIVIHSAATINFNEPLSIAVNTNLRSMRELIRLGREMKDLKVKLLLFRLNMSVIGPSKHEGTCRGFQAVATLNKTCLCHFELMHINFGLKAKKP
ncbi:hypothetical protein ACKWTF_015339 [Chironomus riparius]